ncbi:hypothetical protein COU36_00120 [Candidatus Micrarchaeota archaeon CG10_big_fil_rev_8_21_14_0_10_59_7]|nr:MAG: hypothetical protein COU36_00120 [Candidatus Micrarchaeota archaeon CG10_big_fil_rev_8_21_14_0_10_59_7]
MANITLSVPDALRARMLEHGEISWSGVVRSVIEGKLEDFKRAEALVKRSRITEADVASISAEVGAAAAKHARALLR